MGEGARISWSLGESWLTCCRVSICHPVALDASWSHPGAKFFGDVVVYCEAVAGNISAAGSPRLGARSARLLSSKPQCSNRGEAGTQAGFLFGDVNFLVFPGSGCQVAGFAVRRPGVSVASLSALSALGQ